MGNSETALTTAAGIFWKRDIIAHLSFFYIKFTVSISKKDVERVAHLARIRVAPDELARYQEGLANILALVAQMQDSNTDEVEPMAHPQDIVLRLREDRVTEINERSSFQIRRLAQLLENQKNAH